MSTPAGGRRPLPGTVGQPAADDVGDPAIDERRAVLRRERADTAAQIAGLAREFDGIVEAAELVATDDEHDPEGHTIAFERQQVATILRDARARLVDIDDALTRLATGTYGTCARCGDAIALLRLDARPATRTCVTCAV